MVNISISFFDSLMLSRLMKKALGDANTGCSKTEPKIFVPPQTPVRGCRTAKIFSYLRTQFGEDRCTQFRVIVVTDPQSHKHTNPQTEPITIHCAAAS